MPTPESPDDYYVRVRCNDHLTTGTRRRFSDRYIDKLDYVHIRVNGTFVAEHRHVMEQHLGRALVRGEAVHHINGDRADNRLVNLELWFRPQPGGQRVEQLIKYVKTMHADKL